MRGAAVGYNISAPPLNEMGMCETWRAPTLTELFNEH